MFRLLALLPLPVLYVLLGGLAWLVRAFGWRKPLVRRHLDRCLGELPAVERERIARGFYGYLGQLAAEALHGWRIPRAELERRVRLENPEPIQARLDAGQRVLLLAAHHCNWEWLLLRCSTAFGQTLTAAYKPASRAAADRALKAMRGRFGATLVPAKQIVQHLIERRGAVRLLALNADQSPAATNEQQLWLPFFGEDTAFFRGPGWIAARMGYAVYLAAMRRDGRGRYSVTFMPLTEDGVRPDADRVLSGYARTLEAHVRRYPVEYFWAYNRWKRARRLYD